MRGYDLAALRARQVNRSDFQRFDLLLAMDRENYETLCLMATPVERDRVHLFLDFATELGHDEVPDPYYGGPAGFETVLDLAEAASRGLLRAIRSRAVARL